MLNSPVSVSEAATVVSSVEEVSASVVSEAAVVSAVPAVVVGSVVLPPPQAARDSVMAEARTADKIFFVFLIIHNLLFVFAALARPVSKRPHSRQRYHLYESSR